MPNDETTVRLGQFFDFFFKDVEKGYICLASQNEARDGTFKQYFAEWPRQRSNIPQTILALKAQGLDVWYCPVPFSEKKRHKETALSSNVRWSEFDGNAPASVPGDTRDLPSWEELAKKHSIPVPTLVIQSSVPSHQHVFWRTERSDDITTIEDTNRALTSMLGADKSGWDITQLLRVPWTTNHGWEFKEGQRRRKPWVKDGIDSAEVVPVFVSPTVSTENDFSTLKRVERQMLEQIAISDNLPTLAEILAYNKWDEEIFTVFSYSAEEARAASPDHRSGTFQRLAYMAAERGFTDDQIYALLSEASKRWDLYEKRSKSGRDKLLRDALARARGKVGYISGPSDDMFNKMLADAGVIEEGPVKVLYTDEELRESDFSVEYLIPELMPEKGYGFIAGQPGVGKTTFGLQMMLDIAAGRDKTVFWDNDGPKKVLMLSLEMPPGGLKLMRQRFDKFYEGEQRHIEKNLVYLPQGQALPLDRVEGKTFLENILSEVKPDILFIDSIQKIWSGPLTDELGAKDLNTYMAKIRNQFDCGVIAVHHETKQPRDDRKRRIAHLSDVYGNQFLFADLDFVLSLHWGPGGFIIADESKNRYDPQKLGLTFSRNDYAFRFETRDDDTSMAFESDLFVKESEGAIDLGLG